jgi:hypothetical protein
MATTDEALGAGSSFNFTPLDAGFPSLQTSAAKDSLAKWNLDAFTHAKAFRFDHPFDPAQADAFLLDFFASPAVQEAAPVCTAPKPDAWGSLGALGPGGVKYARLPTTVLRLDFFDRLTAEGIVRAGDISKCLDVQCGEVLISDRLRKLFLDESSEEWGIYSEAERNELIFHVLRRLAVGGGMNQYDDAIEPYLSLTKSLYKDLVTVNKTAAGALQVHASPASSRTTCRAYTYTRAFARHHVPTPSSVIASLLPPLTYPVLPRAR